MVDHEFSTITAKVYLGMGLVIVVVGLLLPPARFILLPWLIAFAWAFAVARLCEWIDRD